MHDETESALREVKAALLSDLDAGRMEIPRQWFSWVDVLRALNAGGGNIMSATGLFNNDMVNPLAPSMS
jgi:hypothetical protein